jgi:hypothetical protein
MRVLPLVLHATARVPALTALFSDALSVASMVVTPGQSMVLTTPAAHGFSVGGRIGLSIVDADVPNQIIAARIVAGEYVEFTTRYPHDLTTVPGGDQTNSWNTAARLSGFALTSLTGLVQLASAETATTFAVRPSVMPTTLPLTGTEALLERLQNGVIGWHVATATSTTELRIATPATVTRSYSVPAPSIVRNVRIAGALTLEVALQQYTRGYGIGETTQSSSELAKSWMFIVPSPSVRLSRDRNSSSDAVTEQTPGSDMRQLLLDGFHVYAMLPATGAGSGVQPSDLAHGEVLATVLRTFHGLSLPRREIYNGDAFVASMIEHGNALGQYDRATYVHGYVFEAPAYLTRFDAIQPFEWSRIDETTLVAASGLGPGSVQVGVNPTAIAPIGTTAMDSINFGPEPVDGKAGGILREETLQPLTALISLR